MKTLSQMSLFITLTLSALTLVAQTDPQTNFKHGQFELAAQAWADTLSNISQEQQPKRYIDTSLSLSAAYLSLGRVKDALNVLKSAFPTAEEHKNTDSERYATVLMHLSDVYLAMRDFQDEDMNSLVGICTQNKLVKKNVINEAMECLKKAEPMATNVPLLSANLLNKTGNILMAQEEYKKASSAYQESIKKAESAFKADNPSAKVLTAKVTINLIQAMVKDGNKVVGKEIFEKAYQKVESLPDSHDKAFALISLAKLLPHLQVSSTSTKTQFTQFTLPMLPDKKLANELSNELLTKASKVAKAIKDNRAVAYANGYRAQLYAQEKSFREAVWLTRKAIAYAHNPNTVEINQNVISNENCDSNTQSQNCLIETGFRSYPKLLFSLEWQLGRFLKQYSKHQKTVQTYKEIDFERTQRQVIIDTYLRAKQHLRSVREKIRCGGGSHFLEDAEKFSAELTELYLQKVAQAPVTQKQDILRQAIDSIEFLKETELQNYFHDVCVTKVKEKLKWQEKYIPHNTAIFYPVILDDHIELLVVFHDNRIKQFKVNVIGEELKKTARNFWQQFSDDKAITRAIDNDKQYRNFASRLYQWLIKPIKADLDKKGVETLVIVPDKNLYRVPFAALYDESDDNKKYLIEKYALAISPAKELTDIGIMPRSNISALLMGLEKEYLDQKTKLYFPKLKFVKIELGNVAKRLKNNGYDNVKNEDNGFTSEEVRMWLNSTNYSIVHFSTHGYFAKEPNNSFLVAEDGRLTLDGLETYFQSFASNNNPIDLLILSACQSGLGGGQGLAGIAIKAGTRSAFGTLWQVNEESTSDLIAEFYYHLIEKKVPKAQALQKAQISLLKDDYLDHPYYWAAFLLIGNWR